MRLTIRASRSRKRRLTVAAGLALAVGLLAPLVAPSAGAQIANAGDVTVSMHLSVFTPSFTVAGMSTMGTESATVRENGLITIPQSSLSFQPVEVQVNLPDPSTGGSSGSSSPAVVTVQAVATSDFSGGLDPANGSAFLVGNFELLWSSSTMNNCTVGPFRVVVRSNAQGAISYSTATGSVSMVDPDFTVNAIPNGAAGCGGNESAINNALSLPVTTPTTTTRPGQPAPTTTTDPTKGPPVPAVVLSLTFTPAPRAAVPQPVQHHPRPTTTAAPTTTTAAPPIYSPPPPSQTVSPPPRNNGGGGGGGYKRPKSRSKKVNYNPKPKQGHPNRHPKKPVKRITPRRPTRKPSRRPAGAPKAATARPKAKKAAKGSSGRQLSFVPAAFVKRSPSALATGLNLAGLLGLLVFSSLALWLVTSELSEFKAGARRQRMHRIAGVTDNR